MRFTFWTFAAIGLCLALGIGSAAWADSDDFSHTVTVSVADTLSITFEDDPNFTLTFADDFGQGSVSTGKTVVYTVRANTMSLSAIPGAVSAKISAALSGIDLKGFPGDYTNEGTSGYAVLEKVGAEAVIGTTATALFNKPASSGSSGSLLKGKAPVHYRAVATRDLSTSDGGTVTLTVTLKDS